MTGVFLTFLFSATLAGLFILLSSILGPKNPNPVKDKPFECGKTPFALPQGRLSVRFYLAAMLFVLFDVELVFFFPWAVVYRGLGVAGFFAMLTFLFFLVLGFGYAWRKGVLEFR